MNAAASLTTALTTANTTRTSTRTAPRDTLVGFSQGDDKPRCVGIGGPYELWSCWTRTAAPVDQRWS